MPSFFHAPKAEQPKKLLMPELNGSAEIVVKYLAGRGIHREVIDRR